MPDKMRMIVVDDDPLMLESMKDLLEKKDYEIHTFRRAAAALEHLEAGATDVVVSDIKMPDMSGLELLEATRKMDSTLPVIMMTAYSTVTAAVEAMKRGAYDYVQKPFDVDELDIVVRRAFVERRHLLRQDYLTRRQREDVAESGLIGKSSEIERVLEMVRKVAPSESTVLICGESGTGKEVVARHIHQMSLRSNEIFVPVNAAAIPEALLESELFGHVRGAFTSADRDRKGLFEMADGGTLFLDEIAEIPVTMQPKLLRAIEESEIRPVGSNHLVHIDARLIVSTNADLAEYVRKGDFREDLFYRLNVFPITLPPLRDRREDIPLLAEHFLRRCVGRSRRPYLPLSSAALDVMVAYDWPGNVRELENVIERAVIVEDGSEIAESSLFLPGSVRGPKPHDILDALTAKPFHEAKAAFEKHYIVSRLAQARQRGSMTALAEELGVHRTTLYELIQRHGIDLHDL